MTKIILQIAEKVLTIFIWHIIELIENIVSAYNAGHPLNLNSLEKL